MIAGIILGAVLGAVLSISIYIYIDKLLIKYYFNEKTSCVREREEDNG